MERFIDTDLQETIKDWIVSPATQESEELASQSMETKRIPDPYLFLIRNGKLVSPSNGKNVEEAVTRNNFIEEAEFQALLKIQDWANNEDQGTVLWFSPPYAGGYQCLKIVASEIKKLGGEKTLFNRALVLDVSSSHGLAIANLFHPEGIKHPEELRQTPIFIKKDDDWRQTLRFFTNQIELIDAGEDIKTKAETLKETGEIYRSIEAAGIGESYASREAFRIAEERDLIGDRPDSCQTANTQSAFGVFFENSLTESSFPCPRCNGPIASGYGITTCPHCGLTKEEAGSTCG